MYSKFMDINQLKEYYIDNKLSTIKIAKIFNTTPTTIRNYLIKNNIKTRNICEAKRSIKVSHNYFKKWSSNMAYILGFITADGSISSKKYNYTLSIRLNPKDKSVLDFIKDEICFEKTIKNGMHKSKNSYHKHVELRVDSKEIIKDLNILGIYPNKTGKEKFCTLVPKEYLHDYIRGYFDGDGYIGYCKRKGCNGYHYSLTICSASEDILNTLKTKLNMGNVYNRKNHYVFSISKKNDIIEFYKTLYTNNNFCLLRKKKIFEEIINGY